MGRHCGRVAGLDEDVTRAIHFRITTASAAMASALRGDRETAGNGASIALREDMQLPRERPRCAGQVPAGTLNKDARAA